MTTMYGLARLGRDAELRHTPSGQAVLNLSLAFNYGRKGDDGKRPTQWVDGAMFGDRAAKMADYMVKGTALLVTLREVHVEEFSRANGTNGVKLTGVISEVEFAGPPPEQQAKAPPPRQSAPPARQAAAPAPKSSTGFDDMEDDIPF